MTVRRREERIKKEVSDDIVGFFQPYAEYAKTVRTWFVAYGIGAPVVLYANPALLEAVKKSGVLSTAVFFLLCGATIQIIKALVYKHAMWHLYVGEIDEDHQNSWWYKAADRVSEAYVIEAIVDIATLLSFGIATYYLYMSVV